MEEEQITITKPNNNSNPFQNSQSQKMEEENSSKIYTENIINFERMFDEPDFAKEEEKQAIEVKEYRI